MPDKFETAQAAPVVSNSNDQAVKVVHDAAGDVIVTGSTRQP
jgi:hypothetical protein